MPVHVLGVRHHGPGSARSVAAVLDELRPDAVVIEGAPELDQVAELAIDPEMVPPVAGLVYDVAVPRRAAFYPLGRFSPEWVALRWALSHDATVRFADLSAAHALALAAAKEDAAKAEDADAAKSEAGAEEPGDVDRTDEDPAPRAQWENDARQDPIALLARAGGQDDPERWWEDVVEQRTDSSPARFGHVLDAMQEIRTAHPQLDDLENQRREAAMRSVIRDVMAAHETVVVVCGAFHAPALIPEHFPSRAADRRLLTKLPKVKVTATWSPWTNERLSLSSGYGAGVQAPGWYAHLFDTDATEPGAATTAWLVRTAQALRGQGIDAAPAGVVEAVRLAETLATVRGRPSPGLTELEDAALAVLCQGSTHQLALVRHDLLVGDLIGAVPERTPMVPLAADLLRRQKTLRLKQTAVSMRVTVDLRQPAQLARSVLFHRLTLLGVPWARPVHAGRSLGTFKEAWELTWTPELAVALVEAGVHGTTIEDAANSKVTEAAHTADLPALAALAETCLLADLPGGLTVVAARLGVRSAHSEDLRDLMGAVEPLARAIRYGDVRGADTASLTELLRVVVTRVCVGLGSGCRSLDAELAARTRQGIESVQRGVVLLDDPGLTDPWIDALAGLDEDVHGEIAGLVDRLLLDRGTIARDEVALRMSRRLSRAADAAGAAAWVDSFLGEEVMLLLQDPMLLSPLDAWVSGVDEDVFDDLMPLLRRTFSRFPPAERRNIGELLVRGRLGGRAGSRLGGCAGDAGDLGRPAALTPEEMPVLVAAARLIGMEVSG